jgi:FtsH-binding integral membrane protein
MAERYSHEERADIARTEVDIGLREYLLTVYNYMGGGLVLTGIVSYAAAVPSHLRHAALLDSGARAFWAWLCC